MLVVLNQVDRLDAGRAGRPAWPTCAGCWPRGLRRRAGARGVRAAPARGWTTLRAELAERATARRASVQRLEADLGRTRRGAAPAPARTARAARDPHGRTGTALVDALTDAAGADTVAAAVAGSHRARAAAVDRLAVHPLAAAAAAGPGAPAAAAGDAVRAGPDLAARAVGGAAGPGGQRAARADRPGDRGPARAVAAGGPAAPPPARPRELPDLLDRTVAGTDLGAGRRPRWWRLGRRPAGAAGGRRGRRAGLAAGAASRWTGCGCREPPLPHVGPGAAADAAAGRRRAGRAAAGAAGPPAGRGRRPAPGPGRPPPAPPTGSSSWPRRACSPRSRRSCPSTRDCARPSAGSGSRRRLIGHRAYAGRHTRVWSPG